MRRTSFLLMILIVSISSSITFAQYPQNGYVPSYGYSGFAPVYGYGGGWTTNNYYNPMQNYSLKRRLELQREYYQIQMQRLQLQQQMRQQYYQNLRMQMQLRNNPP